MPYRNTKLRTNGLRSGRSLRVEALESRRLLALTPELAVDAFPGMTPAGSFPSRFLTLESHALFWANDGTHGTELWRTDGTAEGTQLLKDIRVGSTGSNEQYWVSPMTVLNGVVYFTADDGVRGKELWRTDGSTEGTYLVKDLSPGVSSTFDNSSSALAESSGSYAFFSAGPFGSGKLIVTDGTDAGTRVLKSFGQSWLQDAEVVNDTLYFSVSNGTLWKSDGTDAGTVSVANVLATNLTALNGRLLFLGSTNNGGGQFNQELWASDGTSAGTAIVKDIVAGNDYSSAAYLTRLDDHVFFRYRRGIPTRMQESLWKSDGTAEGTVQISGVSGVMHSATVSGSQLFYIVDREGIDGTEQLLRVTNTTAPQLVHTFYTSDFNYNTNLIPLLDVEGTLYLGFRYATWGGEFVLWKTDGTASGTIQLGDVPVTWSSQPTFGEIGGSLLFASGRNGDTELWRSQGASESTERVRDINPGVPQSANIRELTAVDDKLFFLTQAPARDLWVASNGGTTAVRLATSAYSYDPYESVLTNVEGLAASAGRLFLTGSREDWPEVNLELFASDGTEAGTALVKDIDPRWYYWCDEWGDCDDYPTHFSSRPNGKVDFNGQLYFSASNGQSGRELWKSDGTSSGTVLVKDINPGSFYYCEYFYPYDCYDKPYSSSPEQLTVVGNQLFFTAISEELGRELWVTDGTLDGTRLVMDVREGSESSQIAVLGAAQEALYFVADDGLHGAELWRSGGSAENTSLVADLGTGATSAQVSRGMALGNAFYFSVQGRFGGWEVWRTEGTPQSTAKVATFAAEGISAFAAVADTMSFVVDKLGTASELWYIDESTAGAELVRQFDGGVVGEPLVAGDRLFLSASDGDHGLELWVSDLTDTGTYQVADIREGSLGSEPAEMTLVGDTIFFAADDGLLGRELWKVVLDETDTVPPQVAGVSTVGVPVAGDQALRHVVEDLTMAFSEAVNASISDPASWLLMHNGVDESPWIDAISFGFNAAANRHEALVRFAPALTSGEFTLTLKDSVADLAGNALDGDGDGQAGGNYSIAFSVLAPLPTGDDFRVNTFTAGDQRGFPTSPRQIAMAADGSSVVTWSSVGQDGSGDEIYFQRYDANGDALGDETRANTILAGNQRNSTVSMAADGSFVVTWNDDHIAANGFDIYARRFDALGQPLGDEFLVNAASPTGAQRSPVVATAPDGRFAIVWHGPDASSNGIYVRLYDTGGIPVGDELLVNQTTAGQQQIKSAAFSSQGRLFVVWQSDGQDGDQSGIYVRLFGADGAPLANELLVPQTVAGNQQNPSVAADKLGRFLVTWTSSGAVDDIMARRFDELGQPLSGEFLVNEVSAGVRRYSTVAMDSDGDVLVSWSSMDQDGAGYGVYARRFNAANEPEGHEFRVNTFTAGNQLYSGPALDDDGDFTIVWSSMGQDGSGYGVYGRRYEVPRLRQAGDTDGDGDVDLMDLNNVRNNFGGTGLGDTNDDGFIDLEDLNAVRNNFGASAGAAATKANAVEPRLDSTPSSSTPFSASISPHNQRLASTKAVDLLFARWSEPASLPKYAASRQRGLRSR